MSDGPKCEFLVRGETGRQRCGGPAYYWRNSPYGVFYYCEACGRHLVTHPKFGHKLRKLER